MTTTTTWRPLARSSADWHGNVTPCEAACEDAIWLGSEDGDEPDRALRILNVLTGRCHHEVVPLVEELLALADEICEADTAMGQRDRYGAAIDEYLAALTRLAAPRSFDAAVRDAMQLTNRALSLVPAGDR